MSMGGLVLPDVSPCKYIVSLTWDHVAEAYGGHGDEGEVECVQEGPFPLPYLEDESRHREEDGEGHEPHDSYEEVLAESYLHYKR